MLFSSGKTRRDWLCQIGFDLFIINHFFFTVYYGFKIAITDPEINSKQHYFNLIST